MLGAFLFLLVTIPLARLVDYLISRQQRRTDRSDDDDGGESRSLPGLRDRNAGSLGWPPMDETAGAATSEAGRTGGPCSGSRTCARASARWTSSRGSNIDVNRGEVVCVIGPSGSGKSTLLRCINLLEPPNEGHIYLEGKEITGKGADEGIDFVRRRVGWCSSSSTCSRTRARSRTSASPRQTVLGPLGDGGPREGRGPARARRPRREDQRVPRPPLGRPAAARRDRPGAGDGSARDAVRRGHIGARPGAGQGGPRRHARARERGHDHGRRHPRDEASPATLATGSPSWTAA